MIDVVLVLAAILTAIGSAVHIWVGMGLFRGRFTSSGTFALAAGAAGLLCAATALSAAL